MFWPFLSKRQRLERKIKKYTDRLNNLDRINKGFRSEINETSSKIDLVKDENEKKKKSWFLFGKRKEQSYLEKRRFRYTRELNKARNELNKLR
jgi:hypothetical protein